MQPQDGTPRKGDGLILTAKKTIASHIADVTNHPDIVAEAFATIARSTGASPQFATKFATGAVAYLAKNGEALANCTPQSFLGAIMALAQAELTLDPAAGLAYLMPFKRNILKGVDENGKKTWESVQDVQLSISYKGYITLLKRQFPSLIIDFGYVLKGEKFESCSTGVLQHLYDLNGRFLDDVQKYNRATFFYAEVYPYGAKGKSARKQFFLMSLQEVERRRLMSFSQKEGELKDAWEKSPITMAYGKLMRDVTKKLITIDPKGSPKESLAVDEDYTYSTALDSDDAEIYTAYHEPPASESESVTPATLEEKTKAFFAALDSVEKDPTTTHENVRQRIGDIHREARAFFGGDALLPIGFIGREKEIISTAKAAEQPAPTTPEEGGTNG